MMIDLTGENPENSFAEKCRFVLKEKDENYPQDVYAQITITILCGIIRQPNVSLRQIIRGLKTIKRFTAPFSNVMCDLFTTDYMSVTYNIPGDDENSIRWQFGDYRDEMNIDYYTLYKFAADITGDKEKYSIEKLENEYKKNPSVNPNRFTKVISNTQYVPEFIKKIARDMQADPDFEWSITGFKAKDPLNSLPQILIWLNNVNPKKNKISVLRNRLRTVFTGFTYFEQKEIRSLFKNSDARRQHGVYVYIVFNTEKIDLPLSQCNKDKIDYQFEILSDASKFTINILNIKYFQFDNSMSQNEKIDAFYRRYTTIERIVGSNDLKRMEDLSSLEKIQGKLIELNT